MVVVAAPSVCCAWRTASNAPVGFPTKRRRRDELKRSRGAPNRKLQQYRFAAGVVGAGALVVCSRSRRRACTGVSPRLSTLGRVAIPTLPYEERCLLYNRAPIHPAEPTVMNDGIVSSPMRTENQRSATSRPGIRWLAGSSTFPDLRRKNSLLSAKNSLFRCVGNSAASL